MTDKTLSEEGKLVAADGVSTIPTPVDGEGGKIAKRKADLKKEVDPNAETLPTPPLSESEEKSDKAKEFLANMAKGKKGKSDDKSDCDDEDKDDEDDEDNLKEESAVLNVFEGIELSDETKRKLKVVFEAAVTKEVNSLVEAKVKESLEAIVETHEAEITSLKESHVAELATLEENLETFAKDASDKWLEENKIAIQDAKTVEMAEAFVNTMKDIFVEHSMNVDFDSAETIASLEEEIESANAKANQAIVESMSIKKEMNKMKSELVFNEISEGLSTNQADKLRNLSTKLVMEDVEQFKADLISIKESFFPATAATHKELEESVIITENTVSNVNLSEDYYVNQIVKAIDARKQL